MKRAGDNRLSNHTGCYLGYVGLHIDEVEAIKGERAQEIASQVGSCLWPNFDIAVLTSPHKDSRRSRFSLGYCAVVDENVHIGALPGAFSES